MTTKIAEPDGENLYDFISHRTSFSMIDGIVSHYAWKNNFSPDTREFLIQQPLGTWRTWLQESGMLAMAWVAQKQDCWEDPVLPFEEFVNQWHDTLVNEDKSVTLLEFGVIVIGLGIILDQWVEEGMESYM